MSAIGVNCRIGRPLLRDIAMESSISLHGDLENNPFRHSQPVEADESIRDVVIRVGVYAGVGPHFPVLL